VVLLMMGAAHVAWVSVTLRSVYFPHGTALDRFSAYARSPGKGAGCGPIPGVRECPLWPNAPDCSGYDALTSRRIGVTFGACSSSGTSLSIIRVIEVNGCGALTATSPTSRLSS
jgi:hypothetical protein